MTRLPPKQYEQRPHKKSTIIIFVVLSNQVFMNISAILARCLFATLLMSLAPTLLFAFPDRLDTNLPEAKSIHRFTLPNGIRCLLAHNAKPERRAEIRLVVNAGSLLENDDQRGLAHVLEHLAFNGSKRFPKQAMIKYLEERGMSFGPHTNAYTTQDETVYQMQIPTDSLEVMATALDIVADWSSALTLDSASIEKERLIVTEEWRLGDLGVQGRISNRYFTTLAENTRYADRFAIGTKSSLDTFRHEAVRRFYRDWYTPENMTLIVVGDIQPDSLEKSIRQHLAIVPPQKAFSKVAQERALMGLLPQDTGRAPRIVVIVDKELPNNLCVTTWRSSFQPITTASLYRANLLRTFTLSLINSRLQDRAIGSTKPPFRSASVGYEASNRVMAAASLNIEPSDALFTSYEEALAELYRIRRDGFLLSEIGRMKQRFMKNIRLNYNERSNMTSDALVQVCVNNALTGAAIILPGDSFPLDSTVISDLSAEELRQTARELFQLGTTKQLTFIATPPQDSIGIYPENLMAVLRRAEARNLAPYTEDTARKTLLRTIPPAGKLLRERTYPRTGVTEWQLSNGVRVLLKPTIFKNDQILLHSFTQGGLSLASEEEYTAASRAAALQSPAAAGLGTLSPSDYAKMLAGTSVAVNPFIDGIYHGMSGAATVDDLETMFQIFYAAHTSPRIDSTNIREMKSREEQTLALRRNHPLARFQDTVAAVLYGNHYTMRASTKAEIERWNHAETGYAFYQRLFGNMRSGTVVLVGAFDVQRIKPLVLRYCGALPTKMTPHRFRDRGALPLRGQFEILARVGKDNQASTYVYYHKALEKWAQKTNVALEVVQSIADVKLREALRNDAGGVYASEITIAYEAQPTTRLMTTIVFPSEPERTEELYQRMQALWKHFAVDGFQERDLQEAKTKLRKAREISLKDNSAWLVRLMFWTQIGESPEQILDYEEVLQSLTLEDIRQAARTVLLTPDYARFVLLPESRQ